MYGTFNTSPTDLAPNPIGTLFIADRADNLIRRVSATGVASTLAGTLDGGLAEATGRAASFDGPSGLG